MSHHRGSMSMATLGGARRKSILPDYKMLMRSDDGRFNHILYQAGPWAEWQARAPSQLAAHGIDGTNLWEATQFEADRPRYGKPDRPGGACGMLSTYGTSPQQPRRLRSPNRIFAGENDAEGAHVRGPVSFVPPRESGLAAGRATQGVVATSGAFMSDEPTLGSSSSTPWLADGRLHHLSPERFRRQSNLDLTASKSAPRLAAPRNVDVHGVVPEPEAGVSKPRGNVDRIGEDGDGRPAWLPELGDTKVRNERIHEFKSALAKTKWGKLRGAVNFTTAVTTAHHKSSSLGYQPRARPGLLPDEVEGQKAANLRSSSEATMSNPQKRRERHHGDLGIPAIPGTQGPAESWDRERGALRGQSDISKEANPYDGTRLGHRAPHAHSATAHIPLPLLQVRALAQSAAARLRREPAGAHEAPKGRPCRVDETARARKGAGRARLRRRRCAHALTRIARSSSTRLSPSNGSLPASSLYAGHFRHVYTDIQFQRDPYAVTDRLRKERKDAEAELYGDVTFEVDPDLDFKRRSNHSDLHHGNWDHEYHKVKRETDAELERAHPKVESPRQGIRYGRRRLPSHIRPNHNGGVI